MSWFQRKRPRQIIGGLKDDVRIDGALPKWPRPEALSAFQKAVLGCFLTFVATCLPVFAVLILTGLDRPVGRYFFNDATAGISSEVRNWWSGGNYDVILKCPAPSYRPLFSEVTARDEQAARRRMQDMQPDCTVEGAEKIGQTIFGGNRFWVRMMCFASVYRTAVTVSGVNIDEAADFAVKSIPGCTPVRAYRLCSHSRRHREWNCSHEAKSFDAGAKPQGSW